MHWRLLYFKCGWWGYFLFVRSYSQWSLLHWLEKCLQFSRTECTKWFCQLIFFFVRHFIYLAIGRRHKSHACCQQCCSWNGDPFAFRRGWDLFFLGKTWMPSVADCRASPHIPTVSVWRCSLKHSKERETDLPTRQRSRGLKIIHHSMDQRCREIFLQQSYQSFQKVTNVALRVG